MLWFAPGFANPDDLRRPSGRSCYLLLFLIWKRQLDLLVLEPEAIDSKRYR
jgi:hypothetical protein